MNATARHDQAELILALLEHCRIFAKECEGSVPEGSSGARFEHDAWIELESMLVMARAMAERASKLAQDNAKCDERKLRLIEKQKERIAIPQPLRLVAGKETR